MTVRATSIYFDHNATTAVAEECLAAMDECLRLGPLNPSSKHSLGDRAKALVAAARSSVAAALGATAAEIVFTSSGTESNHLAILGSLALFPAASSHHFERGGASCELDAVASARDPGRARELPTGGRQW